MAYGRRTSYSGMRSSFRSARTASQKSARYAKTAAARTRNKAVKRVYRRAATVPRTIVGTNTKAITTLARQVKSLQNQQLGSFQKNWEHMSFSDTTTAKFQAATPICFAMNNFLTQSHVYAGLTDTTSVPGKSVPGYLQVGTWAKQQPLFHPEYDYWRGANDDIAGPTHYRPISTTVNFSFRCEQASRTDLWVRLDIIKARKILTNTNVNKLLLPNNVQCLGFLASEEQDTRNRINREYFTVIRTKWVKLTGTPHQIGGSSATTDTHARCTHRS